MVGGGGAAQGFVRRGSAAQGFVGGRGAAQGLVGGGGAAQGLVGGDDELLGNVTLECGGNNITAPTLDIQTNSLPASQAYNNPDDAIFSRNIRICVVCFPLF